jgi:membrane-bound lytic murein transglycosylase D
MAAPAAVNLYLSANILLVLATALLTGIRAVGAALPAPLSYRHQLHIGHALATAAVLMPLGASFFHHANPLAQVAQIWSAPTMQSSAPSLENHRLAVSFVRSGASMSLQAAGRVSATLFLAGLLLLLGRLAVDVQATMWIISDAQVIRRRGYLRILSVARLGAPFSFWLPGRYFIVVPFALVLRLDDLRLAIRHEAQHHRQLDTRLVYLYQISKALFFWNPAVHLLERSLRELQEFSCDEALCRQRDVSAQEYCRCLLRIAETAIRDRPARIRASMAGGSSGALLKRRIEVILRRPTIYPGKPAVVVASAVASVLMAATALAFSSPIHDRRISAEEARRMAVVAQQGSIFPLVVNDRVVEQLNLLLATPDGRAYLQAGFDRMRRHRAYISDQIIRHGMPLELLAVPLVESGYRNLPPNDDPRRGAGLWMFIASTAGRFGLSVGMTRDERLDVPAETTAAMQLFTSLRLQFKDWGLALLGYNAGSASVEKAIRETGSRDVWEIIDKGYQNDPDYLPRVMAAILIIKNPSVLD